MELPQSRPYGAQGGRKTTHDFLSLYSPVQQDPSPPPADYFQTHDFLRPLEQAGKKNAKDENHIDVAVVEKPPPPSPHPSATHILPGGTYSICFNDQRISKAEGSFFRVAQTSSADRNDESSSNCSSYTGSGFTLWDESAVKREKTGKENISGDRHVSRAKSGANLGGWQWKTSLEQPSQSSSSYKINGTAQSPLSSTQPQASQKSQDFINMMTPCKTAQEDDDDEEEEFIVQKEPSSQPKGNLSVEVNGKCIDQKPSTPRSKHSATEQRRRSKINDRFQRLRTIIPNSDQKRDKASFLLEVIEYIQYLQEKVQKHEGPYQGWDHKPSKLMPRGEQYRTAKGSISQPQCTNSGSGQALIFPRTLDDNKVNVSSAISINGNTIVTPKELGQDPEAINKLGSCQLQRPRDGKYFGASSSTIESILPGAMPNTNKTGPHLHSHLWQSKSCTTDMAVACDHNQNDPEQTIESGTISVSTIYSQGLLNSLTEALQNSGVDLSQASISVKIDLGKNTMTNPHLSAFSLKDNDVFLSDRAISKPISADIVADPGRASKRIKTSIS